jgi:YgiT-type zinc finger domain-containing protein
MAHKEKGEIELRIEGKLHLVRDVSYEECPSCGERVLAPELSQTLYDRIKNDIE